VDKERNVVKRSVAACEGIRNTSEKFDGVVGGGGGARQKMGSSGGAR